MHALSDANYSFLDACPCDLGLLPMGFRRGGFSCWVPFPTSVFPYIRVQAGSKQNSTSYRSAQQ